MVDVFWYVGTVAVGVLIGFATLPWSNKPPISKEGPTAWLLTRACFWPFLLVFAAWEGGKAYRKAWRGYFDRRQAANPRQ